MIKLSCLAALLSVIATSACGSMESFPPHVDAGPPTIDAGPTCDGVCLEIADPEWIGPNLMWFGDTDTAPACPPQAPSKSFTGRGYLEGPIPCNTCTCGPAAGECSPPDKVTAAAASCAGDGPGVTHTSFDPLTSWKSGCTAANAIPAGQLCGGVPCVQSVTIVPSTALQFGCLPGKSTVDPLPPWTRFAQGCRAAPDVRCNTHEVCFPASPGPEFKQCIFIRADPAKECPVDYPNKNFFYDFNEPMCTSCTCAAPCAATFDLYQDNACGTPLDAQISINATTPGCVNVPPGSALGSLSVFSPFAEGGHCTPSGGAPRGRVVCCQP